MTATVVSTEPRHDPDPWPEIRTPSRPAPPTRVVDLRAHARFRGPFTAGSTLLRLVVPDLVAAAADDAGLRDLLRRSALAVTTAAPDLGPVLPDIPRTLTELAQGEERTRFYSAAHADRVAYVISELTLTWARRQVDETSLVFWDLADADPTDTELVRVLTRRSADPLRLVGHDGPPPELVPPRTDLAAYAVETDGTTALPEALAAYAALADHDRRALHDQRADAVRHLPGATEGALPYHLERGTRPMRAVPILVAAVERTFRAGLYQAGLALAQRGRALTVPDSEEWIDFSRRAIGAHLWLDRPGVALDLLHACGRESRDLVAQMRFAYLRSMLYTRHLPEEERDQDLALEWANIALAMADAHHDPDARAFFGAFMRNAKALIVLHRGDPAGALALVEEAVAVADATLATGAHALHRSVLVCNRGRVLFAMGDLPGAQAAFDEVIARDPDYEDTYFDRAAVHRTRGDLGAARADLESATSLSLAFPEAHYNLADVCLDLGDDEAALAELDRVLDIEPDHVDALVNRSAVLLALGQVPAAEDDVVRAVGLAPHHAHAWSALGLLRLGQGEADDALTAFTTALRLQPDLVPALANRAVLLHGQGRPADAVRDLDAAIALDDQAALRVNRGVGLRDLGRVEEADADFAVALARPDADPETRELARRLLRAQPDRAAGAGL